MISEHLMLTEIELAKELLTIQDRSYASFNKNIVDTGRVRGINIYKDHINILIENDKDNSISRTEEIRNNIKSHLEENLNIKKVEIDVTDYTGQKSEVSQLLKMSQVDNKKKFQINGIWIAINCFGI